jgi:hypothetical protein
MTYGDFAASAGNLQQTATDNGENPRGSLRKTENNRAEQTNQHISVFGGTGPDTTAAASRWYLVHVMFYSRARNCQLRCFASNQAADIEAAGRREVRAWRNC